MDAKRKLPAEPGSYSPDPKKERQNEPEDFNFEITETPNFETKIEFTAPVNMGEDIDPLAVKYEGGFKEEDHEFEQNSQLLQEVVTQTPQEEILPVNYDQIKTEEDENVSDMRDEYSEASDYPGNSGMAKNGYGVLTSSIDGSGFVLDHVTGQLVCAERNKGDEDARSERPQDFQRSGESYEDGPQDFQRCGESYEEGSHDFQRSGESCKDGPQDSQPFGSKDWFKFPQPIDQKPTSSHISAEQQFPSTGTSSVLSFDHKLAETSNHESSASQPSVSISMLLDHPFTSGFWSDDQQNVILTQPIPFSGDDPAKKIWLDQFSSYPWLCRSDELLRFFCWPCLLFGNPQIPWSVDSLLLVNSNFCGFSSTYLNDHQTTCQHREAELLYITKKNIIHALKGEPNPNQEIWKHLVRAICSERKKKFVLENTLEFESKITPAMKYIFPKMINATAAFKLSKVILAIATHHMKMKIIEDLQKAQYVVLHIEDLSPIVRDGSWLVAIARYVDYDGRIRERVIEFFETFPIKVHRSDDVPVAWIKHLFDDYKLNVNTVGISYSATLVGSKDIFLFNNRLLKWCPRALFFHPPAHSFYKSLLQAMSHSAFCRKYLQELHKICKFLTKYATIILFEQSSSSILPKAFDANFQAKFKSHFPVLMNVFRRVESSSGYRKETRKEASKYLKYLNTLEIRILIILIDRICSSVAEISEAIDGTFHPLNGTFDDFQYLTDLRKQSLKNFENIVANGIQYFAKDELLAEDLPDPLQRKYQGQIKITVSHAREFLMQRFENWDQFRYTDSKLLECSLDNIKYPNEGPLKQLDLDEPELIQLKFFLNPLGGAPLSENKSLTEILTCLARDKRQHEFPGLFKYLQFVHTIACDKRTFGGLLNSVYSFTEIKSPEDLTTAYLDGYFWQVEDISAVMDDPKFYQKALEACQLKVAKM